MNKKVKKVIRNYKKNLSERLENNNEERKKLMFTGSTIRAELSGKNSAISCGGIGLVRNLMNAFGFPKLFNGSLPIFKCHKPYF